MIQFLLAFFGLLSLWMATGRSDRARRWAPVVGLLGQPAWLAFAVGAEAWGLFALSLAYTVVYLRGAWVQWHPELRLVLFGRWYGSDAVGWEYRLRGRVLLTGATKLEALESSRQWCDAQRRAKAVETRYERTCT